MKQANLSFQLKCFLAAPLLAGGLLVAGCRPTPPQAEVAAVRSAVPAPPHEVASSPSKLTRSEGPFPASSTMDAVLRGIGMDSQEIRGLIDDVSPVYDLARVKAGRRLLLESDEDGRLHRLEYDISDEEFLVIEPAGQGFHARKERYRFDSVERLIEGEITDSLWQSLINAGEDQRLVMGLSNIFQWDVDFTAVHPGDSYSVIVEKRYREGEFHGYGAIRAARFSSGGKDFYGVLFKNHSGETVYYDPVGKALRKAFLKVPFSFNPRVTSSFSHRRFHPIHKRYRPHLGVDYGAPRGTPVLASASGRVVFAGRNGGYGNLVRVKHANGFKTSYAHLSRILVRTGQSVSQGQRIGRVGATGTATGPHLDYRVQDSKGRFLNPRKMISWPSDKPVSAELMPRYEMARDAILPRLRPLPAYPETCEWTALDSRFATGADADTQTRPRSVE